MLFSNKTMVSVIALTSALSLLPINAAYAQTSRSGTDVSNEERSSNRSSLYADEIIVTATKRSTSVQSTPLAVTAIGGDFIEQSDILSVEDVADYVPNLQIATNGPQNGLELSIRGVGNSVGSPDGDPAVAFHIDGAYIPRITGFNSVFYDIERVEVLRGPQGTLWGRNATAGAINVVSKKPVLEEFSGDISALLGTYNRYSFDGNLNLPVSDKFGLRAAFLTNHHDGMQENIGTDYPDQDPNNANEEAFRLSALLEPSEDLSILLSGDTYSRHVVGAMQNSVIYDVEGNRNSPIDLSTVATNSPQSSDHTSYSLRGEVTWKTDNFEVVSLTGYRTQDDASERDGDSGDQISVELAFSNENTVFSEELRISSAGDSAFQWLLGGYYFKEESRNDTRTLFADYYPDVLYTYSLGPSSFVDQPGGVRTEIVSENLYPTRDTKSTALFGSFSYDVSDDLSLIAGGRWSEDKKDQTGFQSLAIYAPGSAPDRNGFVIARPFVDRPDHNNDSWSDITWKAGVEWQATSDNFLYASAATGFKSGGFNLGNTGADPSYDPEKLQSFEIGSKNNLLDGDLTLNLTAFYYDYKDLQVSQLVDAQQITSNAATSEIYGLETEFSTSLTDALSIDGSLSYLNATYGTFTQAFNPLTLAVFDASGNTLPHSPELSGGMRVNYTVPVGEGELTFSGDVHYETKTFLNEFNAAGPGGTLFVNPSFFKGGLSARYERNDWFISAFIKNVGDKRDILRRGSILPNAGLFGSYEDPRTAGVRFGISFGD